MAPLAKGWVLSVVSKLMGGWGVGEGRVVNVRIWGHIGIMENYTGTTI